MLKITLRRITKISSPFRKSPMFLKVEKFDSTTVHFSRNPISPFSLNDKKMKNMDLSAHNSNLPDSRLPKPEFGLCRN